MLRGSNKKHARETGHTRAICYFIIAVNRSKEHPMPSMQEFWPIDFEGLGEIQRKEDMTVDEMKQRLEKAKAYMENNPWTPKQK